MLLKKKSDRLKLKGITSAVDIEQADVFVKNIYFQQYYSIPHTVESVLDLGSVCVVPTLTHNLVKNICSSKLVCEMCNTFDRSIGLNTVLAKLCIRRDSTRNRKRLQSTVINS